MALIGVLHNVLRGANIVVFVVVVVYCAFFCKQTNKQQQQQQIQIQTSSIFVLDGPLNLILGVVAM